MMKNIFIILIFLSCTFNAFGQERNLMLVRDMDGDGIADTVRIDSEELKLEYSLSSFEFRSVATSPIKELKSYGSLEPAENGFVLHIDNKDDEAYSADYTFSYKPEFRWMALTSIQERYRDLKMVLPGIARNAIFHNCDLFLDLNTDEVTLEYSKGEERLRKSYNISAQAGGPLQYFSFVDTRGVLQPSWEKLSWYIMDEYYPTEERTPDFIYSLPVDPRNPGLLVHDMDGDGLSDTVRIHRNIDNWDLWLECKLSSQGFESITTKPISSHNNRPGLRAVKGGFELHEINPQSDNYENSTVFVYDPTLRQLVFHSSQGKYFGFQINFPKRIYGLNYEDECELYFFPRQGKYILEYTEVGETRRKEYNGRPVTVLFKDFMFEEYCQNVTSLWNGFVASILTEMNYPERREVPAYISGAVIYDNKIDGLVADLDGDGVADNLDIDREVGVMRLELSSRPDTVFSMNMGQDRLNIVVGYYDNTLIIKSIYSYYCFDYDAAQRQMILTCTYWEPEYDAPSYDYAEEIYFPAEGFVQKKIKSYRGLRDRINLDEDKYITLWETRRVEPVVIGFEGFDIKTTDSLLNHIESQISDARKSVIELNGF